MICKRCGSDCPERPEGLCFHCLVGLGVGLIDEKTNLPIQGVREGFPHWQNPQPSKEELRERIDKDALAGLHRVIPAFKEKQSGEPIDAYLTSAEINKMLSQILRVLEEVLGE